MPRFRYKAIAASGSVLHGELEAATQQDAIGQLRDLGHLPVRADEIQSTNRLLSALRGRWQGRRHVRRGEIAAFTRELATLLQAGLPLDSALQLVEQANEPGPLRGLVASVRGRVEGGFAFSEALAEQPHAFDRLYTSLVRAGEAGGALHSVIERVADYLERTAALRNAVITALVYPAILLVLSVASLIALLTFVVPQFIPLFEDAGATVPLLTQAVFLVASLLRDYWWIGLALLAVAAWFTDRALSRPDSRRRFDGWCLGVPVLGDLIRGTETARLARTLGTLLENGVPLLTGVQLARDVVGNRLIADDLQAVSASLEQGRSIGRPLRETGNLPALAVQLIEVGEESGQLPQMLIRVADIFDKEVQTGLKRLLTVLEPALILGLGGLIAVIIMSILVAILGLNELI